MPNNLNNRSHLRATFLSLNYIIKQVADLINAMKDTRNKIVGDSSLNLFNKTNQITQRHIPIITSYANITSQLLKTGLLNEVIYNTEEVVIDEKQLLLQLNNGRVDNLKIKSEEDKQLCDAIKQYGESAILYDNFVRYPDYTINEYYNALRPKLNGLININLRCNYTQKTPAEIVESIQRVVQNEREHLINEAREYTSAQSKQ